MARGQYFPEQSPEKLEDEIARRFRPSGVRRVDKPNVATSVPRGELERLAAGTDYVLVGVGA